MINGYLEMFQSLAAANTQMMSDRQFSLEIQDTVSYQQECLQPCFSELRRSAEILEPLVQDCINSLSEAEEMWQSKPRIAGVNTNDIVEELGDLTGYLVKTMNIAEQIKSEILQEINAAFKQAEEFLKKIHFFNKTTNHFNKSSNNNEIIKILKFQIEESENKLYQLLEQKIEKLDYFFQTIDIEKLDKYISYFDDKQQDIILAQLNILVSSKKLSQESIFDSERYRNQFIHTKIRLEALLQDLVNQNNFLGISFSINLEDFEGFCGKFKNEIVMFSETAIDEAIALYKHAIEKVILFYNTVLEKQERYGNETSEQRNLEKNWIDTQHQKLQKIQQGLKEIFDLSL